MRRFLYLLFVVALLAVSCQKGMIRELNQIEAIIDYAPDSALVLIEDIPEERIMTTENQALYSLLLSIALDKSYIDLQSDSIIIKAVNYYAPKEVSSRRMKSWYYDGVVLYNQGNFSSSIVAFEKAERDAITLNDNYYLGLINSKKASIYNTWSNLSSAIACQRKAIEYLEIAGKKEHVDYAVLALGTALYNDKQYDQAIAYITDLKNSTSNTLLISLCNLRLASISVEKDEQPSYAIDIYKSIPIRLFTLYDYGLYALAWERAGESDSASVWMDRGYRFAKNEADTASLDYMFSGIELNRGNYQKAFTLVKHATDTQDSFTHSILQESLNTALKDYYREELALQEEKNAREKERRLWMGILSGLGMILMAGFFIWRLKRKDQILELQLAQYAIVQQENRTIQQDNAHLIGSLFSERLRQMDKLSDEYYAADEKRKKELVFDAFKSYLEEFRRDKDAFKSLDEFLNRYSDGVMDKLDKQVPRLSGEKRKIVSMFFAGLSYEAIQLITKSVSIESLRMLRSRIRKEIKESGAPDAELFLSMLETKKVAGRQTKTNE